MPRGRPTKRSPEVEKAICDAVREGLSRKDAAAIGGIAESTLYLWAAEFSEFSESLTVAESEFIRQNVGRVASEAFATGGDWRAALEILKRYRRDEWGDVDPLIKSIQVDHARTELAIKKIELYMAQMALAARQKEAKANGMPLSPELEEATAEQVK
jgi:transposase